jgi:hypothetical protein
VAVALAALAAVATLAVAGLSPASASTVNGIATTALPSNDTYLASGGSNTLFTVTLPSGAVCTGDTAHDGYHVWSYLVKQSQSIAATTFSASTGPSQGFGLYESDLNYYGPVNTAQNTGQIIGIPNDFSWGAGVAGGSFTAPDLLYTGGTSGIWEAGIACANSAGTLTDNWNTEVTFTSSLSDPNLFTWSAVPGPSGSTFAAITSADATTFTEGTAGSFTPTATGTPAPTITETGPLPTGVTFTGGSLTGTATESGTFPITFKANNGIGNPASQAFTLTVGGPPSFTSANNASFTEGSPSTFTPVATGSPTPTVIEAGPLPTGVSFTAGSLTGTPTVTGTFPITFTASNGILPNATQNFTLTVGIPPVITSAAATTFSEGSPGTFTPIATGTPAPTFGETGALPTGVTFTGGSLTGTPTVTGSFPITLTASNGILPDATQAFTLTVGNGPVFTSPDSTSFVEGTLGTFTPSATGTPPPTITQSGPLPTGVTFTAGSLTGTPTVTGAFPITFTASNGAGPDAVQAFTLNVGVPPAITSAAATTFVEGTLGTFTPTATGTPPPTFGETGALPAGVTFTAGSLTGTPTVTGSFPITFTASNGILPDATQAFVLTVNSVPVITSASSTTFTEGTLSTFTPTATGTPAPTFGETGPLPTGVTFTGGSLTGTPTVTGSFPITFTASNGVLPNATQSFTLTVASAPAFTSAASTTFTVGTPGSFTPTASGSPVPTITETGPLPTGVTFTTGSLTGTPTQGGVFPITFTASNGAVPSATQNFTLTVNAPPAITSAASTTFFTGTANTFTVTATGTPAPTLGEAGPLPVGVTFDAATGVLSGTPTTPVHAAITFTATNGIGSPASQSFTLTVSLPPLVLTTTSLPAGTVGVAYSQALSATGGQSPYTWSLSSGALPAGLTLDASTGTISGSPTAAGTADFTAEVTDGNGTTATSALSIGIASPVVAPTNPTLPVVGMASTPNGGGYWLVDAAGDVAPFGSALTHGSLAGVRLNAPITRIVSTPDGGGYWLVGADGGIFSFGNAGFYGSTGGWRLNAPIVGLAPTTDGHGYWLVGADGGVFSFGDAVFRGSMGGVHLNKPVVGIAAATTGGYWLVAADGGIFSFHAPFYGTTAGGPFNSPINGMAVTTDGGGYWLVAGDGGIFNYGDAGYRGSMGGTPLNAPVVGMAADASTGGYWLVGRDGGVFAFHAPFYGAG